VNVDTKSREKQRKVKQEAKRLKKLLRRQAKREKPTSTAELKS